MPEARRLSLDPDLTSFDVLGMLTAVAGLREWRFDLFPMSEERKLSLEPGLSSFDLWGMLTAVAGLRIVCLEL